MPRLTPEERDRREKERRKAWKAKNKEKVAAGKKAWKAKNKEKVAAWKKKKPYAELSEEKKRAICDKQIAYYQKNRETMLARARVKNAKRRKYDREAIRKSQRSWLDKNKAYMAAYFKAYRENCRDLRRFVEIGATAQFLQNFQS